MVELSGCNSSEDDVVISGIGGRFPLSENMSELEYHLFNKTPMVKNVKDPNWNRDDLGVPDCIGRMKDLNKFDTSYFGISPIMTKHMDPMTRITLETTFEAIVDSGNNPVDLKNTQTSIFVGSNISDSESTWLFIGATENGFSIIGHNRSMLANRISYWLNTNGPSYAYVTTETAGLDGITMAYEAIKSGRCVGAVVGTVSLVMHPESLYQHSKMNLLSKDGQCRSFDADCDGFARSDSCVVLYLQKARDAKRIYATVVHSDKEYFGDRKAGLVRPLDDPLISLLTRFYDKCGIDPSEIVFLEANGCGVKVYDEEEFKAIEKVLLNRRRTPLLVGSVKSNLGHSDAASAFCSVAKVLIAMETGYIPPNLNYNKPASFIPALLDGRIKVMTEKAKWDGGLVALNSIGSTGSYAHTLLRSYTKDKPQDNNPKDGVPRIVCVSGRTEEGITKVIDKLKSMPVDIEFIRLLHDIHSSNIINHNYRGYILLPTGDTTYTEWKHFNGSFRPLWFVFSGMGSQWVGMGQHLMKLPVLAATLEKCHNILVPFGIDLLHILTTDDSTIFNNILHSFVGIASIQMALVELLRLLNIVPDGLIGHSVGELGCAYADGCFSAEQMILAAYYRGMASLETELINGSMAAVGLSSHKVKDLCPPGIDVACHNSGESSTISGPTEEINTFVAELKEKGIFAKAVNVSNIAYHSRYIKPAAPKLLEYLKKIIPYPKPRSSKWFSTSVPESDWDSTLAKFSSAEYHTNNLLSSVLFEETSKHIPKHAITIEIAPHGLLQAILRRSLGPDCINISLTQRGNQHGLEFLLNAVGKMYLHGICPRVHELYPVVKYPVSRGTPSIGSLVSWDHTDTWHTASQVDMSGQTFGEHQITISLNRGDGLFLKGCRINDRIIYPASACLKTIWLNLALSLRRKYSNMPIVMENVRFYKVLEITEKESLGFTLSIQKGTGDFEIFENKRPLVTGQIRIPENAAAEFSKNISVPSEDSTNLTREDVYSELKHRGYHYSGQFKGILNAQIGHEGSISVIEWSNDWLLFLDSLIQLAILHKGEDSQQMQLPVSFQKVIIDPLRHPEKREQKAIYQKFSNILTCGGVEIRGIELFKLTTENYNSIKLDTFRFLSHSNPQLKFQLNTVFSENILQLNKDKQISLILANKDTAMQAASITNGAFLLARFETSQELNFGQELVVIIQQQFEDGYWVLLKKVVPVNDRSSVIHLSTEALVSPGQLRSSLNVGKDNGTKVYVVAQNQNIQDVETFVTHIYKNLKSEYARYVFVLDQSSTTFSPTGRLFRDQLSQDLTVNVYFNGSWGSLRHLPLPQSAAPKPSTLQKLRPYLSLKDWDLSFISLNYEDWCLNRSRTELPPDIGVVDLSGWSPEGKRVMALAHKKDPNIHFKTNPHLIWSIPDSWSLEDAATVPLPYAMAYYGLVLKAAVKATESILVHGGHSSMGQAFLAVAIQLELVPYTTVTNTQQKEFIRTRFPQILESNIYKIHDKQLPMNIMKETEAKGIDIIVNCLQGQIIQSYINCLAYYGRFLNLCMADMQQNQLLGMQFFLRNTGFFGVLPDHLFDINPSWCEWLHSLVEKGIDSGVVKPFARKVFTFFQEDEALRTLNDDNYNGRVLINIKNTQNFQKRNSELVQNEISLKFMFNPEKSFIIVGGRPEDCLNVVEWLSIRGARLFTICSHNRPTSVLIKRRARLLCSYYHVRINIVPTDKTTSLQGTKQLIQEATTSAPLGFVCAVSLDNFSSLHNLDVASRNVDSLVHFMSLLNPGSENVSKARRKAGLPMVDIQWSEYQKNNQMSQVLVALDVLLNRTQPESVVFISLKGTKTQSIYDVSEVNLSLLLPYSLKEFEKLSEELASKESSLLVEVSSLSPGLNIVQEVPPIYFIPGLQSSTKELLEPLSKNLMYPTLGVRLPGGQISIQDMAAQVSKSIRAVQKDGPYNIVGASWGAIVAMELARELEDQGQKTQLFILDGAPETTQSMARQLGEGHQLQVNLLTRLLNITSNKVYEELIHLSSWEDRLCRSLMEINSLRPEMKHSLSEAVNTVYHRVNQLLEYKPHESLLQGHVSLIRPKGSKDDDNLGLDKYFKQSVSINIVNGDHRTILSDRKTANIISDKTMVDLYCRS